MRPRAILPSAALDLDDYISVPAPRTKHLGVVKHMLQEQHGVDPDDVEGIDFFGDFEGPVLPAV